VDGVTSQPWDCFPWVLNCHECQVIRCHMKGILLYSVSLAHNQQSKKNWGWSEFLSWDFVIPVFLIWQQIFHWKPARNVLLPTGVFIYFCRDSLGVRATVLYSTTHTQTLCLMVTKSKKTGSVPVQKSEMIYCCASKPAQARLLWQYKLVHCVSMTVFSLFQCYVCNA